MFRANLTIHTSVDKKELLETLKKNLERHSSIVQEARDGYIKKAKAALKNRLEQLRQGKIVSLQFTLTPPADYSEVYRTAISMLEWDRSTSPLQLPANEFRQLVLDEWDWQQTFLASNMAYSRSAYDWMNDLSGGSLVAPTPVPDDDEEDEDEEYDDGKEGEERNRK